MNISIDQIVEFAASQRVSDIHLVYGLPPKGRIDGQLESLNDQPLTDEDCERFAKDLAGDLYPAIMRSGEIDLAKTISGEREFVSICSASRAMSQAYSVS